MNMLENLEVRESRNAKWRIDANYPYIDGYEDIGEYKTFQKAIKVLDMIQEQYDNLNMYHNNPEDVYVKAVFQMPQDLEVEE